MTDNNWTVFNGGGAVVADNIPLDVVRAYLTPERMERGWTAVHCIVVRSEEELAAASPLAGPGAAPSPGDERAAFEALLDGMASQCIDRPIGTPPREILQAIIQSAVAIALEPLVSSDAQALIDRGRVAAIEQAVARINATIVVEGESHEHFRKAIAGRVADVAKATAQAGQQENDRG